MKTLLVRACSAILVSVFVLTFTPAFAADERDSALGSLFEATWARDLAEDPLRASYFGERRYDDKLTDLSPAAIEARRGFAQETLAKLRGFDRANLSRADQLSYDLFEWELQSRLAAYPFKPYLYELRTRDGPQSLAETAELLPFQTVADYDNWNARLEATGRYVDQWIALLQTAVREKRTQPRVIMDRVLPLLQQQIDTDPQKSAFYAPFRRIPDSLTAADRERIVTRGRAAIVSAVIPAYQRFEKYFRERYLPACRQTVGIWDTPQGEAFYRNRITYHTTTQMSADEIHTIGLAEVKRIRGEMQKIIEQVGWKGTFAEFLTHLRTDPQFYFKTPEELFQAYSVAAKKIDPELVKLFGTLPRTPYGLRAIPALSAPNTTTAYYQGPAIDGTRPGYYYVNLYRPEVRPKYEIEVLTVHEAVPGHHLQIALAQEQPGLPTFRRNGEFTAYVEGWALYSESLGEQLGLYRDPYSKFGQLTYDMWRAVRLVVDTGIHQKRWTRQQAIDFFKENAAKTETDIINEIDRYISWPGQALAYKIGQLKIMQLRQEAQTALGAKFDIRKFHDALLATGAVPLEVLEREAKDWVARQQAAP